MRCIRVTRDNEGYKLEGAGKDFHIRDYRRVQEIKLSVTDEGLCIKCVLIADDNESLQLACLRFSRVTNLKLENLDGFDPVIQGIDLIDIRKRGWERVNWEMIDYEDNKIHWYSENVEVEYLTNIQLV